MTEIILGFEMYTETPDEETGELVRSGGGKEVSIPLNHTVIAGKTGTGKSHLLRGMIERSKNKALVFELKSERDFIDFPEIALYFEQGTGKQWAMSLKNMIESTSGMGIRQELPILSRLCSQSSNLNELIALAKEKQESIKSGYNKDRLEILTLLIEPVLDEFNQYQWDKKIDLKHHVNVMDLSAMSTALQQIVLASILSYIFNNLKKTTTCIDEAHRFIPQKASSAARLDFIKLMREGRAREDFVWIADQTITGIDKEALKQVEYWILGRQTEWNEAKRILNQIPYVKSLGLKVSDIQTLGLGEFIVVTPKWTKTIYAQPSWLSRGNAIKVAKGKLEPEDAARRYEKKLSGDDDMAWKDKHDELKLKYEKLEQRMHDLEEKLTETHEEKLASKTKEKDYSDQLRKTERSLADATARLEIVQKMSRKDKKQKPEKQPEPPKLPDAPNEDVIEVPESISVETIQPALTIIIKQPPLTLTYEDLIGKIAIIYAEDGLPKDKWFTSSLVGRELTAHGWVIPRGTHVKDALDQLTKWGYLVKKMSGRRPDYKLRLLPEQAVDMGLLKTKIESE